MGKSIVPAVHTLYRAIKFERDNDRIKSMELRGKDTTTGKRYQTGKVLNLHSGQAPKITKFVMDKFVQGIGSTQIVVATSDVEVGIDFKDLGCRVQMHARAAERSTWTRRQPCLYCGIR